MLDHLFLHLTLSHSKYLLKTPISRKELLFSLTVSDNYGAFCASPRFYDATVFPSEWVAGSNTYFLAGRSSTKENDDMWFINARKYTRILFEVQTLNSNLPKEAGEMLERRYGPSCRPLGHNFNLSKLLSSSLISRVQRLSIKKGAINNDFCLILLIYNNSHCCKQTFLASWKELCQVQIVNFCLNQ